jgi:hypothetical protein
MKRLELDELALSADEGGSVLEKRSGGLVSLGSSTLVHCKASDPLDTSLSSVRAASAPDAVADRC